MVQSKERPMMFKYSYKTRVDSCTAKLWLLFSSARSNVKSSLKRQRPRRSVRK